MKKHRLVVADSEPTWGEKPTHSIISAYNWYNVNKDKNAAAKYLNIKDASIANKFMTLAWSRRMQALGCVFDEKLLATIAEKDRQLQEILASVKTTVQQTTSNVISIQDRINEKTDYYIMELEGAFDDYMMRGAEDTFNAYNWMTEHEVKSIHATKIAEYFRGRAKEFIDYIESWKDDKYIQESFPKGRKWLIESAAFMKEIVVDAEKLSENKKTARAPRKKKPVSIEKKVKNLKYLNRYDELKLQSTNPTKIPGSMQLWVYNVKKRQLGVYNASDASGLEVKGSAILNYSVSTSVGKTLRKPESTLKIVTDGGKIQLRKALDSVNSKPKPLTGRINKDTILLRIV